MKKYKVTGGGFGKPYIVSAMNKAEAKKKAQKVLKPVFGNVPLNRLHAEEC